MWSAQTLDHEVFDHTMKLRIGVSEALATLRQLNKVLHRFWNIVTEQTNHNSSFLYSADFDVEKYFLRHNCIITQLKPSNKLRHELIHRQHYLGMARKSLGL